MKMATPSYDRAPSYALREMLSPGGFLAPLVELNEVSVDGHVHDVHLRRDDEVHVYRGLTRLLVARLLKRGDVRVSAHRTYSVQECANGILRTWHPEEGCFKRRLGVYLRGVRVGKRHTEGEGLIQSRYAQVRVPWTPFDREVVLRYKMRGDREDAPQVDAARRKLEGIYAAHRGARGRRRWSNLEVKRRSEVDQLAVDPAGNVVLIELKDASKPSAEIYYAPFQLFRYVWEWRNALKVSPRLRDQIQELIESRRRIRLTPESTAPLSGGIRPVIGFGPDERTDEVRSRYERVLGVVKSHWPPDVDFIETWTLTESGVPKIVSE